MDDFDFIPLAQLQPLVQMLLDCGENCGAGILITAPLPSEVSWWRDAAVAIGIDDFDADAEGEKLALSVHAELESFDSHVQVTPDLALGDLSASESRLMLLAHGVKAICYVSSHDMDPLWASDGVAYHTIKISPACGSYQNEGAFAAQLHEACDFLRAHRPAMVVSSCPQLRAAVIAAMLLLEAPTLPISDCLDKLEACRALTVPLGNTEMHGLEKFVSDLEFHCRKIPYDQATAVVAPKEMASPTASFGAHCNLAGPVTPSSKWSVRRDLNANPLKKQKPLLERHEGLERMRKVAG